MVKVKSPATSLPKPTFNILLVDDHDLFRRGLADLLHGELDMTVLAQVGTGAEALIAVAGGSYDLVIMDIGLGDGTDGIETTSPSGGWKTANFRASPSAGIRLLSPIPHVAIASWRTITTTRTRMRRKILAAPSPSAPR